MIGKCQWMKISKSSPKNVFYYSNTTPSFIKRHRRKEIVRQAPLFLASMAQSYIIYSHSKLKSVYSIWFIKCQTCFITQIRMALPNKCTNIKYNIVVSICPQHRSGLPVCVNVIIPKSQQFEYHWKVINFLSRCLDTSINKSGQQIKRQEFGQRECARKDFRSKISEKWLKLFKYITINQKLIIKNNNNTH